LAAFDPAKGSPGATFLHAKGFIEQFLDPFVDLFAWGILERHPRLRIVIAESGVGWVPWVVEELDYRHWRLWEAKEYWADKGGIPHQMKPSELFKRQVYATFQQSPTAMRLLEFYGEDKLLWASDYPHPDSIWPNSRKVIEQTMGHLPPETVRKLTSGNAAKLYGLDIDTEDAARVAAE
jgi:predicted TIM-barrel fold metal-dependent hydrolase